MSRYCESVNASDEILRYLSSLKDRPAHLVFCEMIDEKSKTWNLNRHQHRFLELIYILEGKMSVDVKDSKFNQRMYSIIAYPPNVLHLEHVNMQMRQKIICLGILFDSQENMDILQEAFELEDSNANCRWLFESIVQEYERNDEFSQAVIQHYISALLNIMSRHCKLGKDNVSNSVLARCFLYIQDNIRESITLEDLTKISYISESQLIRIFRKHTGMTPMAYVRKHRIELAQNCLSNTNDSIASIGFLCGFVDEKYFSRVFKSETGMSPREYRKLNAGNVTDTGGK